MTNTSEPLVINTVGQKVEILPGNLPPLERVGRMARLCYKLEPKEGEDSDAINKRIVEKCIREGHESILGHAIFSLYLPVCEVPDSTKIAEKITGAKNHKINFRHVWEMRPTDAQQRYLFAFNDAEAMRTHCYEAGLDKVPEEDDGFAPVVLGNARAFRLVIREKLYSAINLQDDPIALVVVIAAAYALYEQCPVMFQDIIDSIKEYLTSNKGDEKSRYRVERMLLAKLTDTERSDIGAFVARFLDQSDVIFAVPATAAASISMIITTDRATTHQHVRHSKDVAYTQESQRYVNYDKKGYNHMAFTIDPTKANNINVDPVTGVVDKSEEAYKVYEEAMRSAFEHYHTLLELGVPSESARKVLPNDCTTKIGVTWLLPGGFGNFLFWRIDKHAQFDIRRIAVTALIDGLEEDRPYFSTFSPIVLKQFLIKIKEQKLVSDERIDKLVEVQDKRVALINEFQKQRAEEMARLQKEVEEKAKEEAEKHADDPNALPEGAPKVIKIGEVASTDAGDEPHTENAPRIDRISVEPTEQK